MFNFCYLLFAICYSVSSLCPNSNGEQVNSRHTLGLGLGYLVGVVCGEAGRGICESVWVWVWRCIKFRIGKHEVIVIVVVVVVVAQV